MSGPLHTSTKYGEVILIDGNGDGIFEINNSQDQVQDLSGNSLTSSQAIALHPELDDKFYFVDSEGKWIGETNSQNPNGVAMGYVANPPASTRIQTGIRGGGALAVVAGAIWLGWEIFTNPDDETTPDLTPGVEAVPEEEYFIVYASDGEDGAEVADADGDGADAVDPDATDMNAFDEHEALWQEAVEHGHAGRSEEARDAFRRMIEHARANPVIDCDFLGPAAQSLLGTDYEDIAIQIYQFLAETETEASHHTFNYLLKAFEGCYMAGRVEARDAILEAMRTLCERHPETPREDIEERILPYLLGQGEFDYAETVARATGRIWDLGRLYYESDDFARAAPLLAEEAALEKARDDGEDWEDTAHEAALAYAALGDEGMAQAAELHEQVYRALLEAEEYTLAYQEAMLAFNAYDKAGNAAKRGEFKDIVTGFHVVYETELAQEVRAEKIRRAAGDDPFETYQSAAISAFCALVQLAATETDMMRREEVLRQIRLSIDAFREAGYEGVADRIEEELGKYSWSQAVPADE